MTPKDAVKFAKDKGAEFVDLKFMDFIGTWQHFGTPISELEEDLFDHGLGFDGSSIRGWQPIHASDMLIKPDPATARMEPFAARPTVSYICNVFDPISGQPYTRDPRNIAQKAEKYLKGSGIADTAYFGPEAEFFVFDEVRYEQTPYSAFYAIDSTEGSWNTGRDERPNLGYKPRTKEGYFPAPPTDSLVNLRQEMVHELQNVGIRIEAEHHEVASGGQCEIDMRFAPLVQMADNLNWFKYIIKNVARRHNKTVTFMPKPIFEDNGSGMHVHQSLWKDGKNLFAGEGYAGISELGMWYIGGIIHHAPALVAITNPTTNSYKRLVPGFEAPTKLAYSGRNRSAAIRIPMVSSNPKAKRIEFRTPDPSCNGYLAFAACLMAGLDGIENKMDPGEPLDKDIYALPPEELAQVKSVPGSLDGALEALAKDHAFLLRGDVFTEDVIENWIEYKYNKEVQAVRLRPSPYEFQLYFDV